MIDPASIVGLTFAIFDQLLKLGERSAELTADIRGFSDVRRDTRPLTQTSAVVISSCSRSTSVSTDAVPTAGYENPS